MLSFLIKEGGRRSPAEEVSSEGVAAAFSQEATNPCREPIWPRALDNPKLPFWGLLSSWCLAQGAGLQSAFNASWQQCGAGADSLAPCAFALNSGVGRGQGRRMAQRRRCDPHRLEDCFGAAGGRRGLGSWDSADAGEQPVTPKDGPRQHKMTIFASHSLQLWDGGMNSTGSAVFRNFLRGQWVAEDLDDRPW